MVGDRFDALENQLKQLTRSSLPKSPKEKESLSANRLSPSQSQVNNLLELYRKEGYDDAEKLAVTTTQEFPKYQFVWKVLGAIFRQTGRKFAAVKANYEAVGLSPLF